MTPPVIPGAEAWSADGGPHGVLCIHGFTGNPTSMRGLAEASAAAGFAVELPRLPGHGTTVEDMMGTGWADWSGEAEAAYQRLAARVDRVVVMGLSMGGALTAWLASRHPEIAGIVCINALVTAPEGMEELMQAVLAEGTTLIAGIGSDVADPDAEETAYAETPVAPALTLFAAAAELDATLDRIACPTLVITSRQDHVVPTVNSDLLAERVSGPVERLWLERSYHVATIDYDRAEVEAASVAFAQKVTAG